MTTQVLTVGVGGTPAGAHKWVYDFTEGSREMRDVLGGKGAGVAEMTRILGPDMVPAGFTITTEACVAYMRGGQMWPEGLQAQVDAALTALEQRTGKGLGDADDPLLVSVRSGARVSMPGMMDTVLNLGLNDESTAGLAARTGDERFARDCYRRLVQMFGNVVRGIPGGRFEDEIARVKRERGVTLDTELDADALRELTSPSSLTTTSPPTRRSSWRSRSAPCSTPGWVTALSVSPDQPSTRRLGHCRQRAADGVRQQGRGVGLRRGVQPRRGDGCADTVGRASCPTPRARTWSPVCGRLATSPNCTIGCPRWPTS